MKKLFTLALLISVSVSNLYSTPEEFWKELPCISRKQCNLDAYVGSQKYKYLVVLRTPGGLRPSWGHNNIYSVYL